MDLDDMVDEFKAMPLLMKVGLVAVSAVGVTVALGYFFKSSAHCVRGWKELQSAIKH